MKKLSIVTYIRFFRRALRPVGLFWNQSIELNNLIKIFTSKKIFKWIEIWVSRRALRPVGLFFKINRKSTMNFTSFVLYVFRKYVQVKSYESELLKILLKCFVNFRVRASFGAFRATKLKILTWGQSHLFYMLKKISAS